MSEENKDDTPITTSFKIEAAEGSTVSESETLKLTVEGGRRVIAVVAEIVLTFLQDGLSGEVVSAHDADGNPLPVVRRRQPLDPLSTGDDPVEA
jgi:hypothetical protein